MTDLQRIAISSEQLSGATLHLDPEQRHYLCRVLRLRRGDRFIALDEQDSGWVAALNSETQAQVLGPHHQPTELPCQVTLQMAMPKTGMEDIIRQTTELGVYDIQPVTSDRVILKPSAHKLERWQRVAREAAEQSERQHWPRVYPAIPWRDALDPVVQRHQAPAAFRPVRYICTARRSETHLLQHLTDLGAIPAAVVLAVGPEGGWTEGEVEAAMAADYQPASLGTRILRAVTAPVAAMTLIAAGCDVATPLEPIHIPMDL
ncbi:MAG: 16S rRNA (uracil(1498)-N(3))-methyltransferase [Elainellaceae cyanobacterium]